MKELIFRVVGLDCDFVIRGETEEEVMKKAVEHVWEHLMYGNTK